LKEEIKQLIELQNLDLELQSDKREMDEIPAKIDTLNEELDKLDASLKAEKERLDEDEKERRSKEVELKEEEIKLKKARDKLNVVKTNKEYKAALKEVEDHNRQNSLLEERILALMDELDSLRNTVKELESDYEKRSEEIGAEIEGFTKKTEEIDKSIEKKQKKRNTLLEKIDPDYSTKYNRLINNLEGQVVVGVVNGVCNGCFINLPPQFFNEMLRDRDIKVCPNCSRLIFFKEEETKKNA
jgi:predicted  nucleic acid-binding Zn-ribbon protein